METVKVTINETVKEYPKGISYMDIVKEYPADEKAPVILVVSNGKPKELHKKSKQGLHPALCHNQRKYREPCIQPAVPV